MKANPDGGDLEEKKLKRALEFLRYFRKYRKIE
jgi:hypothetical protein